MNGALRNVRAAASHAWPLHSVREALVPDDRETLRRWTNLYLPTHYMINTLKNHGSARFFTLSLFAAAATLCAPVVQAQAQAQALQARAMHPFAPSKPVQGRYIVVFKNSVGDSAAETANAMRGTGGQLLHSYSRVIKGFAAALPEAALQGLRNNPNVDYIEQDQTVALNQVSPQNQATWGLDRIDQADRPLDSQYTFRNTGAGVKAFIIDTGIRADHVEFGGRVLAGYNAVADANGTNDCNGHGTHVAGTVGGATWGVAKSVTLIPVRVLDCAGSGTWSGVIAGIDWVAASTARPAVANMSLGGGASASVDAAVAGAVNKGITMVVAAGNSNADACQFSPASAPTAITVGATTGDDQRASYSNFGSCVDIFAPGSNITSAWNTSATAAATINGTSMAAPHVTGVVALALFANPTASPAAIDAFLKTNGTLNRLGAIGAGSPNLLVTSMASGAPNEAENQVAAIMSLAGQSFTAGSNWKASATVAIRDVNSGAALANVTVTGSFSAGGSSSCVTSSAGSCTMGSSPMKRNVGSTVFIVADVSATGVVYDAGQNAVTQITVTKP